MKILHTSDWHLGHTLYNYDRTVEQQAFLRQLTRIVTEEQPDAMVVSGDIYHYSSPAAATQKAPCIRNAGTSVLRLLMKRVRR